MDVPQLKPATLQFSIDRLGLPDELAQSCHQQLILQDVLFVLVKATYQPVNASEPPRHLLITEESAPHDREVVLFHSTRTV